MITFPSLIILPSLKTLFLLRNQLMPYISLTASLTGNILTFINKFLESSLTERTGYNPVFSGGLSGDDSMWD